MRTDETARIHVRWDDVRHRWETRVTFDVAKRLSGEGFWRDGLEWPYFRPRSRSRDKVILKSVKALLRSDHHGPIEVVPAKSRNLD